MFVFIMIWTVHTAVDTVVGKVERSKHDDTVSVKFLLDLNGQVKDLLYQLFILTCQQDRGLPVA